MTEIIRKEESLKGNDLDSLFIQSVYTAIFFSQKVIKFYHPKESSKIRFIAINVDIIYDFIEFRCAYTLHNLTASNRSFLRIIFN